MGTFLSYTSVPFYHRRESSRESLGHFNTYRMIPNMPSISVKTFHFPFFTLTPSPVHDGEPTYKLIVVRTGQPKFICKKNLRKIMQSLKLYRYKYLQMVILFQAEDNVEKNYLNFFYSMHIKHIKSAKKI